MVSRWRLDGQQMDVGWSLDGGWMFSRLRLDGQ